MILFDDVDPVEVGKRIASDPESICRAVTMPKLPAHYIEFIKHIERKQQEMRSVREIARAEKAALTAARAEQRIQRRLQREAERLEIEATHKKRRSACAHHHLNTESRHGSQGQRPKDTSMSVRLISKK